MEKRINGWMIRHREEMAVSSAAHFVTLTYAEEHLPKDGQLCKRDLQLFIKSLRKKNKGIRYHAIGEYGSDYGRPHYHIIMYNLTDRDLLSETWNKGFVVGSKLTMGRVRYALAYMMGVRDDTHEVKPFAVMSRRPGIGITYIARMKKHHLKKLDSVVYDFDCANAMPRYYLDKMYDAGQRRYIHMKRVSHALQNPQEHTVSPAEHEKKWRKLNRKNKH